MGVITISREFGSGGDTVARLVADKLGFFLVDHKEINAGLESYGIAGPPKISPEGETSRESVGKKQEEAARYLQVLQSYLHKIASGYNVVILGRGANFFLSDCYPSLRVRIVSKWNKRVERAIREYGLDEQAAIKILQEQDRKKERYFKQVLEKDWRDIKAYDLVINTGTMAMEKAVGIIVSAYRMQEEERFAEYFPQVEAPPEDTSSIPKDPAFMHPSEEDIAGMLDFYRVRWEYEPRTFVLEWDNEGNVQEAFSPDFYLPDYDLYLEITTQKQQLGWKKNKKIRRLKELYPRVNIKFINKKSFQSLLQKFSLGH